jgi:hypothetical protein
MYEVKVCVWDGFKQNNQVVAIKQCVLSDRFHALPRFQITSRAV